MGLLDKALSVVGLGTPDQPAAPDYTGAAEQTAAANKELAEYTTDVNRPDQYTPFGSSVWNLEGDSDWTQTTTLSPEQQALLDQQQEGQLLSGSLGIQGLENTKDMFSTPYTTGLDPLSSYDDQRSNIISQLTSRAKEDVGQARDSKISQLVAAGIPIGSEAYDREMKLFDRRLTDANQQAELGATDIISKMLADQRANRGQIMSEDLTERQTPLNEYAALTSGTPVQNPNMPSFSQQQQILGPDYLNAASQEGAWDLAGWNADVAGNNAILSGLFGVGAAYAGKPAPK